MLLSPIVGVADTSPEGGSKKYVILSASEISFIFYVILSASEISHDQSEKVHIPVSSLVGFFTIVQNDV